MKPHCFTCSKDSKVAAFIACALTGAGCGVLRFDFPGWGGSEGAFKVSVSAGQYHFLMG